MKSGLAIGPSDNSAPEPQGGSRIRPASVHVHVVALRGKVAMATSLKHVCHHGNRCAADMQDVQCVPLSLSVPASSV